MGEHQGRPAPRISRMGDAPRREIKNDRGISLALVDERWGAEKVDVHLNILRPGGPPGPYHFHSNVEDVYIILQGRPRLLLDGEVHDLGPEDVVFIPPGVPHSLSNPGPEEVRLLEIYAPVRPDFIEVPVPPEPARGR
ncbi:MAG: cupin domain-containing protein [Deltaproteobacteria bacterium]|nr:cupin domain-containing protein [Deltaproteobacteria bacterium]